MRASSPSLRHAVGKVYRAAADGVKNFWQKVVPRLDSAGRVPHSWKRGAWSARAGLCRAARRLAIASVCFASLEGIAHARAAAATRTKSVSWPVQPLWLAPEEPRCLTPRLRLRGRRIKEPSMTTDTPTAPHEQLSFTYDDRHWRVRGLEKQLSCERLKVQLMVERRELVHVDTLDLYAARLRKMFVKEAAAELFVEEATIKQDLGHVLCELEARQEALVRTHLLRHTPEPPPMSAAQRDAALETLERSTTARADPGRLPALRAGRRGDQQARLLPGLCLAAVAAAAVGLDPEQLGLRQDVASGRHAGLHAGRGSRFASRR